MSAVRTRLFMALLITLLFISLGLWRFHPVLFTSGLALTNISDGIAAIGGISTLSEEISHQGWTSLLDDLHQPTLIGEGTQAPAPVSTFSKTIIWLMGQVSPPDNAWDLYALFGFVLIGLSGFLLAREVGAKPWAALTAALVLTHLDAFHSRLPYHIFGLGAYYIPLLASWAAVRAGRQPTWPRLFALAFFMMLNFQANEYYGYFGFFFSVMIFAGYGMVHAGAWPSTSRTILGRLAGTTLLFTVLMLLAYPHQIGDRLLAWINPGADIILHQPIRTWPEFVTLATDIPLYIFRPGADWAANLLPDALFQEPKSQVWPWEYSYRIGLVLPAMTCLLFALACWLRRSPAAISPTPGKTSQFCPALQSVLRPALVWLGAALLIGLFGINPHYPLSLVPFTYTLAPIFRVGARAFLYVDIALIMMYTLAFSAALGSLSRHWRQERHRHPSISAFALGVTLLTLADVFSSPLLSPLPAKVLPDIHLYETLRHHPPGPVLELPLFSPVQDPPESNSLYIYHRIAHGQPLLNPWPADPEQGRRLAALADRLDQPDDEVLRALREAGVRYLAVRRTINYHFPYTNGWFTPLHHHPASPRSRYFDYTQLERSPLLQTLAADGAITLYEFNHAQDPANSGFAQTFLLRDPD